MLVGNVRPMLDDDGNPKPVTYGGRDMTDGEFLLAQAAYRQECRAWSKTRGVERVPGQTRTFAVFSTAAGAQVAGEWDGSKWLWSRENSGNLPSGHGPEGDFWPGMRG